MPKKFAINYSGTAIIEAKELKFIKFKENNETEVITGEQWVELSKEKRGEYIIASLTEILNCSEEVNHSEINIEEE